MLLKARTWNQAWEEPWLLRGPSAQGLVSLDTANDGGRKEALPRGRSCLTAQSFAPLVSLHLYPLSSLVSGLLDSQSSISATEMPTGPLPPRALPRAPSAPLQPL